MTEIEQKALALVNEYFYVERSNLDSCDRFDLLKALCRAIEQHEAFKRDVSDAIQSCMLGPVAEERLSPFILPKPVDPLVEALCEVRDSPCIRDTAEIANDLRAALAKRGLEVREIEG